MNDTTDTKTELQKIEEIVDLNIRPSLKMHGGDMEIVNFEDNVLKIKYQGACGCCPGAAMSTLPMIQQILQEKYSADIKVEMA